MGEARPLPQLWEPQPCCAQFSLLALPRLIFKSTGREKEVGQRAHESWGPEGCTQHGHLDPLPGLLSCMIADLCQLKHREERARLPGILGRLSLALGSAFPQKELRC